jgi:exopolysaccharide production protein ExoY
MTTEYQGMDTARPWMPLDAGTRAADAVAGGQSRKAQKIVKRSLDIAIASMALIVLMPLLLLVGVMVKISDGGSVFYAHRRIGLGGREFGCLKFRTMRQDAAERLAALLASAPELKREWEETRKLKDDPRVTLLGNLLRRSSLDELPQLLNVLLGHMSLVGPRPVTSEELPRYAEHLGAYLAVRPGVTGHWQTNGRSDVSYQSRVLMDAEYARNWSLLWDLRILFKTVPVLFSGRGSC